MIVRCYLGYNGLRHVLSIKPNASREESEVCEIAALGGVLHGCDVVVEFLVP